MLAVHERREGFAASEQINEVADVVDADGRGDLCDGHVREADQLLRAGNPRVDQIIVRGEAGISFEFFGQMVLVDREEGGYFVKGQTCGIMTIVMIHDVPNGRGDTRIGGFGKRLARQQYFGQEIDDCPGARQFRLNRLMLVQSDDLLNNSGILVSPGRVMTGLPVEAKRS